MDVLEKQPSWRSSLLEKQPLDVLEKQPSELALSPDGGCPRACVPQSRWWMSQSLRVPSQSLRPSVPMVDVPELARPRAELDGGCPRAVVFPELSSRAELLVDVPELPPRAALARAELPELSLVDVPELPTELSLVDVPELSFPELATLSDEPFDAAHSSAS